MAATVQVLAYVLIAAFGVAHAADPLPQNPDTLLAGLRAKDAQFDNLAASFERRAKVKDFEWSSDTPLALVEREAITDCYLVIRGEETTYRLNLKTNYLGKPLDSSTPRTIKMSNASRVRRNLAIASESGTPHDETRPDKAFSALRTRRMLDEFSLGVGYGTRIQSMDQIEIKDGVALVEATMRLFRDDMTKAQLEIDSDFLVRKATMTATNPDGGQTRFEISTDGLSDSPDGAAVASKGVLKWITLGSSQVRENFSISLHGIDHSLAPETYQRIIAPGRRFLVPHTFVQEPVHP